MSEHHETFGRPGQLMRLEDGTPVSITYSDSQVEVNQRTGLRQQSTQNFTPRLNSAYPENTPIEVPVSGRKSEYFKTIRGAMRGQEMPGVYVKPIDQSEFDQLTQKRGRTVKPDNLDQLKGV